MRKGDIVRKYFAGNIQIGDFAIVNRCKGGFAEILYSASPLMPVCISKSRLKIMSKVSIPISDDLFKRLVNETTFVISHAVSPKWKRAYDKEPDLIVVYTPSGDKATFTVLEMNLIVTTTGERRIQIALGRRLL